MAASSAFYVHFGEQNEAWGCWNPPENWDPGELSEGQLLFESAQRGALEPAVIRDLSRSEFAQTDPSVQRYNWQTCIGTLALTAAAPVGALTLVFTYDRSPSDEDLRIVQLTTSAIVVEESRWAAQQETKQREVQQATMFDAAHDAIMTLDPEGIITYWNRGAERLYGWTKQEAEGQNANALLRTTFPESRDVLWPKLIESGLWEGELTNVTRDGVPVTVASSWTLMKDEGGNPSAILEISSDITERKRAESVLHEAQEELRRAEAIFEALQAGIMLIEPTTHKIFDVNTTAAHLFGAPKEAIIGSVCHQFICPVEVGRCPITDLGQTVDKAERVLLTADGKSRPILKSVSRITLGGHAYVLENFIDISDRKQIESALLDSEAYYRAIFESTAAGMAILEEDMTVAMANSKLEQLTGFSKNEVEGVKPWTEFVAPEDLELMKTYHRSRRRHEDSAPKQYEFRLITKDGTRREVFLTVGLITGTKRSVVSIVDVTALKTAQEAVRKQAAMLDAAHDCIVVFDDAGTLKYWNRGAERFYGWTKQEAEGQNVHTLLQTTFPESREALLLKLLKHGTWEGELVHVARDGRSVIVASSWTQQKNEKGNTYEVLEICSDITERKQAVEALSESERHIRELADALPVVVFETDATAGVTFINTTAFDLLGYTKEELEAGMSLLQLIAPADRERMSTVSERESWERVWVEFTALRKDGSTFPLSVRGVPIMRDGALVGIRGIAIDITERKRAEETLAESEAKLRITLATMVDGILTGGLDWKVTDCNKAVLRMSQRSKEEVIGKPFLDLLAPESRSQILETVPELMERGNIRTDGLWLKKNGETIDVEANVSLIEDAAGQPTAFLAVARDVTGRKQMEQQLDSTLADLQRSNAELEQFAYSASHDLKEPLRMITSYTQIIEEDYKGKLDADADQYIAFTVEGAKRMQTLIDDLLAYSRVGTRG
ncbi:MAG: PAS domain S-box protein, partial [Halobacteriota archaeon]